MSDAADPFSCTVEGAVKLDPAAGGEQAICAAVRDALSGATGVKAVAITIQNSSRASAVMTLADGKILPDVHVASSDNVLRPRSFAMLADGLAAQLKNEAGK